MYRSIAVALDGSAFAEQALSVAAEIARRSGAVLHLILVHVPAPLDAPVSPRDQTWTSAMREQERRYLATTTDRVAEAEGLETTAALLDGPVAEAIGRELSARDIDLAVIASHGRGGISRLWLGSVADRLVRSARRPLLVVRPRAERAARGRRRPFRRILVPLDGSELSEAVLPHAVQLGASQRARYLLVRVVAPPFVIGSPYVETSVRWDEAEQRRRLEQARHALDGVRRRLRERAPRSVDTTVVVSATPASAILEHAAAQDADVIALATHGRGGLRRLVLGSVADKVLRGAEVPVLIYRPPRRAG